MNPTLALLAAASLAPLAAARAADAPEPRPNILFIEQRHVTADPAYAETLGRMRSKLDEIFATRIRPQPPDHAVSPKPAPKKKKNR